MPLTIIYHIFLLILIHVLFQHSYYYVIANYFFPIECKLTFNRLLTTLAFFWRFNYQFFSLKLLCNRIYTWFSANNIAKV